MHRTVDRPSSSRTTARAAAVVDRHLVPVEVRGEKDVDLPVGRGHRRRCAARAALAGSRRSPACHARLQAERHVRENRDGVGWLVWPTLPRAGIVRRCGMPRWFGCGLGVHVGTRPPEGRGCCSTRLAQGLWSTRPQLAWFEAPGRGLQPSISSCSGKEAVLEPAPGRRPRRHRGMASPPATRAQAVPAKLCRGGRVGGIARSAG
jgi:hypothetical protein